MRPVQPGPARSRRYGVGVTPDPTQDDAFASLFRPEPTTPAVPDAEPAPVQAAEQSAEQPLEQEAPRPAPATGRLFRSTAAAGDTAAIPALRADQARALRTVGAAAASTPPSVVISTASTPTITPEPMVMDAPASRRSHARRTPRQERPASASGPGLAPGIVLLVVIVVTLIAGLIDVLIGAGLGWIWGIGMLASSAYAAFAARRGDGTYAVTAPAIAALASVLTVAQLNLGASSGSLFDRAVVAFFALGDHWTWIVGSTLLALAIVAVRARTRRD